MFDFFSNWELTELTSYLYFCLKSIKIMEFCELIIS